MSPKRRILAARWVVALAAFGLVSLCATVYCGYASQSPLTPPQHRRAELGYYSWLICSLACLGGCIVLLALIVRSWKKG